MPELMGWPYPSVGSENGAPRRFACSLGCALTRSARLAPLLLALGVTLCTLPAQAGAATVGTQAFGLAGAPGPNLPAHANHFNRDGFASTCPNPAFKAPTETTTSEQHAYKSRKFNNYILEDACITASLSTLCSGADAVMSESYSPSYDPSNIRVNWIGDLGDNPPAKTSYSFIVAAGQPFETVVDEEASTANCGGVTVTWTSDRPWTMGPPYISGVPAVGRELAAGEFWNDDPALGYHWLRCDAVGSGCAGIPAATGATYTPADADIGHAIALRETATLSGVTSTSVPSHATQPVFIPAILEQGSLASGDSSITQRLATTGPPSSCETPKSAPAPAGFGEAHLYDAFTVRSFINEAACIVVEQAVLCAVLTTAYSPAFVPGQVAQNYVADDSTLGDMSYALAAGSTSTAVVSDYMGFNTCPQYTIVVGSLAPFATASPALSGPAAEGAPQTTTNGEWGGSPSFLQAWLRCEGDGNACEAIPGALGASYTPTAADVGHRLRSRVTATQVNTSSADSAPSPVIGPDRIPPHGTIALGRTNLTKVVKRGFIPVTATCDENCTVKVSAVVSKKAAKRLGKRRRIASGRAAPSPGRGRSCA